MIKQALAAALVAACMAGDVRAVAPKEPPVVRSAKHYANGDSVSVTCGESACTIAATVDGQSYEFDSEELDRVAHIYAGQIVLYSEDVRKGHFTIMVEADCEDIGEQRNFYLCFVNANVQNGVVKEVYPSKKLVRQVPTWNPPAQSE